MDEFRIECQWLNVEADNAEERLLCHLRIMAESRCLTSNVRDGESRDSILVSAYPLAAWLVDNYWRLAYETGIAIPPLDWLAAHDLTAADSGYLWPGLRFISNDVGLKIRMFPQEDELGPHYTCLSPVPPISLAAFRAGAMTFLKLVRERLAPSFSDDPLLEVINQLDAEQTDGELETWRMLEGALGYEPDCAPDEVMETVLELSEQRGLDFMLESAPVYNRCATGEDPLPGLRALASGVSHVEEEGIDAVFNPELNPVDNWRDIVPWRAGYKLARILRGLLGLEPSRRLGTGVLRDWFRLDEKSFLHGATLPLGALCRKTGSSLRFLFPGNSTFFQDITRRFFLARMAAACINQGMKTAWLAFNDGGAWNQKMQRAFAAELLAPIDGIMENLGCEVSSAQAIRRVSAHYEASPVTICLTLQNNGKISPQESCALISAASW